MSQVIRQAINWTEEGLVPDTIVRSAIRRLLRARLASLRTADVEYAEEQTNRFIAAMADAAIAPLSHKANEQHYELPADFFVQVLGPHRKYSACYWGEGIDSLAEAERSALEITCQRAELSDGQQILELGCGWGSLTLYMAERYPRASIVAVSNSTEQRAYIVSEAHRRRLDNVAVLTRDMNEFAIDRQFDRVVSIEMFEHMRNYDRLFSRVSGWLAPHGKFFMHITSRRTISSNSRYSASAICGVRAMIQT